MREDVVELANFVLRLRDGHAVAGDDDHFVGGRENGGGLLGRGAVNWLGFRGAGSCDLHLTEGAEEDVGEGTVHRFRHDDGEDESGGTVECAGDDQEFVLQNESHGCGG